MRKHFVNIWGFLRHPTGKTELVIKKKPGKNL